MNLAHHAPAVARPRLAAAAVAALVAVLSALVLPLGVAHAATAVPLGTAESFAVLAGSTITNTGKTTVTGDIGLDPGTAVTGFGPGADEVTLHGSQHIDNGVALQAKTDLTTAYNSAAGQTATEIPAQLGETTHGPGVYESAEGTFDITGKLTLDAANDPDAVFIFQMVSELKTANVSSVELINGADPCNVYWQVGSSATLGTNSTFVGTIMADQSITLANGATVQGRVLAREAAVTMERNTITNAACVTGAGDGDDTTDDGEDTTRGDDTTDGGDDTTGDDEDTTDGGDTTDDGDTTGQVDRVPSGPVATGGGGVEAATTSPTPLLMVALTLLLLMAGGMVSSIARRRVRT